MGSLSLAHLALPPTVVSLLRIPLAVAFPFVGDSPALCLAVLAAAAVTDVVDGWLARRLRQVTATGAIVDPVVDKLFAFAVGGTLVTAGTLPAWGLLALLAREIVEAPLVVWGLASADVRRRRIGRVRANVPGKVATVVQFGAVMAAIASPGLLPVGLGLAAATGLAAGLSYWAREMAARRLPDRV